ncbi:MAG: methyltransferase domain-containing protein [Clostridia bacterium]|nr:methyltransferase domain-containing protein [Clostridia bacterium]
MQENRFLTMFYENYDEDGRLFKKYGRVEFETTMAYIKKYYKPGMRILEIGAGTGRYSRFLAGMGARVDAVELVERNIEVFREKLLPTDNIRIFQGNAVDLSIFPDGTYDLALLLGPMYHLYETEDQIRALKEAFRVTRKGGIVFIAYCMADPSILQHGFIKGNTRFLIENGLLNPETFETHSRPEDIFELYRKEDIELLNGHIQASRLHFVSADGLTNYFRDTIENMDDETYELYLKYHLSICEREDMTGWSNHTLDILRKE